MTLTSQSIKAISIWNNQIETIEFLHPHCFSDALEILHKSAKVHSRIKKNWDVQIETSISSEIENWLFKCD